MIDISVLYTGLETPSTPHRYGRAITQIDPPEHQRMRQARSAAERRPIVLELAAVGRAVGPQGVHDVARRARGVDLSKCSSAWAADGRAAASDAQHAFARPIKPLSLPSGMDGRSPSRTTRMASATPARSGASS